MRCNALRTLVWIHHIFGHFVGPCKVGQNLARVDVYRHRAWPSGGSQHQNQHHMVPNHLKKATSMLQQGRPSVPRTIDYQEDTDLFIIVVRSL
jgi:hypothetical protein